MFCVVARVANRQILSGFEQEVAPAHAHHDRTLDPRCPDDRSAEDLPQVVEHDETAVLCRLDDARVAGGPERQPVRSADTGFEKVLDRLRHRARVVGEIGTERDGIVGGRGGNPHDPGLFPTVEDGHVLGHRHAACSAHEVVEINVLGSAVGIEQFVA